MESIELIIQGGPTTAVAYAIVWSTKKWVPPRWRAGVAAAAGIAFYVGYTWATGGDIAQAVQLGLVGGLGATGMHEIISKGVHGE